MSKIGRNDPCPCDSGRKYIFTAGNLPQHFRKKSEAGFTYMGLLILLAIMAIVSATALQVGAIVHRRAAEEALLDVGREFSRALESYRLATPVGQPSEPATLQDLLRDPRFPGVVRHLRKLYYDPISGRQEWGIQRLEDSRGIVGIFSLSDARPIKIANFELRLQGFTGKSSYQEWVFTRQQAVAAGVAGSGEKYTNPMDLMADTEDQSPATDYATDLTRMSNGLIHPIDLVE
jgi:type II secretory pathway pseudopilin PulG